jgi:purine nucleoside permease
MKIILALMLMTPCFSRADAAENAPPSAVKVLIVNMFSFEAAPWLEALRPTHEIRVPGLSSDYPLVKCTADAVCEMITGMGHANAAASMMALLYSGAFDLRETYFIVAGIAGIDPKRGTI